MELLQTQDVDIELFYYVCANETTSFFMRHFQKLNRRKDYGLSPFPGNLLPDLNALSKHLFMSPGEKACTFNKFHIKQWS